MSPAQSLITQNVQFTKKAKEFGHNETKYVCTKMINITNKKLTLRITKIPFFLTSRDFHLVPCFRAFTGKTKTWINCTTFSLANARDFHSLVLCGSWKQSCASFKVPWERPWDSQKCGSCGFLLYKNGCFSEHAPELLRLDEALLALVLFLNNKIIKKWEQTEI